MFNRKLHPVEIEDLSDEEMLALLPDTRQQEIEDEIAAGFCDDADADTCRALLSHVPAGTNLAKQIERHREKALAKLMAAGGKFYDDCLERLADQPQEQEPERWDGMS